MGRVCLQLCLWIRWPVGEGGAQGPCVASCHCESPTRAWGPASLPQVLIGDVEDAICLHAFYYAIWKRYGALPERYNWQLQAPDVLFYPLRPELVESTYLLYQVLLGRPGAVGSQGVLAGRWRTKLLHSDCWGDRQPRAW